jgi:hypothetical protein
MFSKIPAQYHLDTRRTEACKHLIIGLKKYKAIDKGLRVVYIKITKGNINVIAKARAFFFIPDTI